MEAAAVHLNAHSIVSLKSSEVDAGGALEAERHGPQVEVVWLAQLRF